MLAGLTMVALADLWERLVFPGLTNFSSDYRSSAPFSGMHTGGATLDAYLALCFPLVAAWLLIRQSRPRTVAALGLLALAAHAGLTTFSRGLYAGYGCSAAIIVLFLALSARQNHAFSWRRGTAAALAAGARRHWRWSSPPAVTVASRRDWRRWLRPSCWPPYRCAGAGCRPASCAPSSSNCFWS
jgi:hypothetical protein